jgi:hypothetical protein
MPLPSWLAQWLTQLAGLCCAERDALLDIKKALDTGGRVLGSWSSSSCQCSGSWMGVTCTDGRLTALWVAATGVKALLCALSRLLASVALFDHVVHDHMQEPAGQGAGWHPGEQQVERAERSAHNVGPPAH